LSGDETDIGEIVRPCGGDGFGEVALAVTEQLDCGNLTILGRSDELSGKGGQLK
jgi:hypothetical protein